MIPASLYHQPSLRVLEIIPGDRVRQETQTPPGWRVYALPSSGSVEGSGMAARARVVEGLVHQQRPVAEDLDQHVAGHALPGTRRLRDVGAFRIGHEREAPPLGRLARVRDRVLEHVPVLAADGDGGAFERALLRVPIQLLEQAAAAPKGDVVEGPSVGFERGA